MIYGPAFYKLLGIPESVTEPTAYHLLDLDPRMVSEALVDGALRERKARIRQNIPGPQFIPIVSLIERELEKAADILRDPQRRAQYEHRLLWESEKRKRTQDSEQRRELVQACRQVVRSMVDDDGCLPEEKRGELAEKLDRLGLPADQMRYVLDHIPKPAREEQAVTEEQRRRRRDETREFFVTAIDLEVDRGLLDDPSERKLMKMAGKFGIPANEAAEQIDQRLAELGAERGGRDEASLIGQFKLHVLAMYPMGNATEMDRKRLLSLAAAEGLSARQAERVLRQYLPSLSEEAAGEGEDVSAPGEEPLAALRELAADEAAAPSVADRRRPGRTVRYLVRAIVALSLVGAAVGISWWAVHLWSGRARRAAPGRTTPGPAGAGPVGPDVRPASRRPPLLVEAFRSMKAPQEVRRLLNDANGAARAEALRVAAEIFVDGATPREQVLTEGLYRALLDCPPANGPVQDAAVRALIGKLRSPGAAGRPERKRLYRAAGMLASLLFLRPTPGIAVDAPAEMKPFLDQCEQEWGRSTGLRPADPANDPRRLAYAVMAGGSLTLYAGRADRKRFAALSAELARAAADPQEPGSEEALTALLGSGGYSRYPAEITRAARLALCDVIQATSDPRIAGRAQATLASALGLAYDDPLRRASLEAAGERADAAAALRRAVEMGPRLALATRPAATQPTSRPATTRPLGPAATLAETVRATWTGGPDTPTALTDLTVTMLACADRVARFTAHSDALTMELLGVLKEADPALRAARLTKRVQLAEGPAVAAAESGSTLPDELAAALKRDLQSSSGGVRNRAVEQLRVLDDPAAAAILLERLGELVGASRPDFPAMNRILRALIDMSDPGIPAKLAALIPPARSNYAAHRIVMTLLHGSGYIGKTDPRPYQLPINHNSTQRAALARAWKDVAVSCPWGPRRMVGAVAGSVGPPPAWKPDPSVEKLLAVFFHYSRLTGLLLRAHKPTPGADVPKLPDVRPTRARVVAPIRESHLVAGLNLLVAELTRLARAHPNSRGFAVKIDMAALSAKSRELACHTALQRAAVALETAGRILEILVLESSEDPAAAETVAEVRRRRDQGAAAARNVLIEMREHCYWNLVLLGMLPEEGP